MPPLSPPEYSYRPDAPLLSFGPAFSEDLARSVVRAIWHENPEQPHETDVRCAAGLTMLEAFHPRDQRECMLAAQGVAAHCAILDSFRRARHPDTPAALVIKFRASAVALNRMFSLITRDLDQLQARPLPPRPSGPPAAPPPPGDDPAPNGPGAGEPTASPSGSEVWRAPAPRRRTRAKAAAPPPPAKAAGDAPPGATLPGPTQALRDLPELPEDIASRPDGTPGSLTAYAPKVPVVPVIPREPPIMVALATRPKPWRMVNVPKDQMSPPPPPDPTGPAAAPEQAARRGPLDLAELPFTGDAVARFAASRLDSNAPLAPLRFDDEESVVELELISTGGDPEAEAHKAALMAAHPEGKPIATFRHGSSRAEPASPGGPGKPDAAK